MDKARPLILNENVFYRLTALWVICEAFAGGILHGLKLPFTGMLVSSLAVMCIILIAWHVPGRTAILRATIIVAIFKLMLSPHAPPTAYVAVFFQGTLGQLLLQRGSLFKPAAVFFAAMALVESSLQRLLVLIILYGNEFWAAVDKYLQKLIGSKEINSYTFWLAAGYVLIHLLVGLLVGWYAARLAKQSANWSSMPGNFIIVADTAAEPIAARAKKKSKVKWLFVVAWLLLAGMFLHAYFYPAAALLPKQEVFRIILRSLLIVLSWYLLVLPLLSRFIKSQLGKQQEKRTADLKAVFSFLPHTKQLFAKSWQISSTEKGRATRLSLFLKILLLNILYQKNTANS